ncbi:MAG: hypothetical protein AMXMBFR7_11030 [Planctomycetota bacterium]
MGYPRFLQEGGFGVKGCLGGIIFFILGGAMIFLAFALGRAWEAKPADQPRLTVDDLKQQLRATEADARRMAAEALGLKGEAAADAVEDLVGGLKDDSADVRKAAAEALGRIGPRAKAAIPQLKTMLREGSAELRAAAEEALQRIEGSPEQDTKSAGP